MIFLLCVVEILSRRWQFVEHKTEQWSLSSQHVEWTSYKKYKEVPEDKKVLKPIVLDSQEPEMLERFEKLYGENSDVVGWLTVPGMNIDYPVMQNEDDEYYLHRNFYGEDDKYGTLYVKNIADVDTPGTNFIIYGHNMKDGSMFGNLDLYREKDFYEEHSLIRFDTLYEERTYEIVAVFLSQVYDVNADVFKYYKFYQAENEEEFNDFYQNIKKLSLYKTDVTAEYGDTFLTLSTCAYHVQDGRLVVVAKRIS